ncbi:544_t:CDS:2 [Funneliformis mosseae]|uniref:544_t:CDS:1 n=1 Tax=Funneliformis mosseae TaxID=27381 RepID=A0A9N8VR96_FUNMO|nr:544_t:CDS:2 [Funneliformis mosseae]
MIGDRRTRLGIKKLENEAELKEVVNISANGEVMALDDDK